MPVIEVSHVTKEYRLGALQGLKQTVLNTGARLTGRKVSERPLFKALDDVSFSIEQGEVVGIIGHNGAGKSTLLKMLARISTPTRGSVKVSGRIAPLIEVGAGFVHDFTGRENVYLNGAILGMSKTEIGKKFDEIVDFAEMAEFIDTPVKRYSSGMQVKLAFAVATSVKAEILIVDEVLAVGDLAFQRKCFDRMEGLIKREGRTVLVVSHNIRQIERLCSRGILLDHGRVAMEGSAMDVCNKFISVSEQAIERASAQSINVQATGDVDLVDLQIHDEAGRRVDEVVSGQSVRFTMRYRIRQPLRQVNFGFGFHTTDFLYLATNNWIDELHACDVEPGLVSVSFFVPRLLLLPRRYSVRLGVSVGEKLLAAYHAEGVLSFNVVSPRVSLSAASEAGFFAIEGHWDMRTEQQAVEPVDTK